MKITVTLTDLHTYDTNDMVLWKTPGGQTYWARNQSWRYDYVIARPSDFAEEQGWTDFGWEDLDDDDLVWDDVLKIEVEVNE